MVFPVVLGKGKSLWGSTSDKKTFKLTDARTVGEGVQTLVLQKSSHRPRRQPMGAIHVHEFMSADGVIDAPTWTFDYGFDDKMGELLAAVTGRCEGILLGRNTFEMFEPAWSTRTVEDDPGAPFFNDTTKYVVSGTLTDPTWRN